MRALKYVVLPDESAVEFQALEAALVDELAPEGALQLVLARRSRPAAWAPRARRPHEKRGVRAAALGRRRRRRRPDPRRQRHPQLRDAPALPERGDGRVHARPQGAPGRAGGNGAGRGRAGARARAVTPTRSAARACRAAWIERTRAPLGRPSRPRPARACGVDAERTRAPIAQRRHHDRAARTRPPAARAAGMLDAERTRSRRELRRHASFGLVASRVELRPR
jgi:hypothetical protein